MNSSDLPGIKPGDLIAFEKDGVIHIEKVGEPAGEDPLKRAQAKIAAILEAIKVLEEEP